jgi:hypothetical protein
MDAADLSLQDTLVAARLDPLGLRYVSKDLI